MAATTREISEESLDRRLAVQGPRDELRELADTIDGLLARLQGAFEAQRRFVANASHELRTPLTTTWALLEMVTSDPDATAETYRDACRQVLQEGERQEELIDALLALAQGQREPSRFEPLDLAPVVREVLAAQEGAISARGLGLESSVQSATISGDGRLIELLVSNLVDNAILHNENGGPASASDCRSLPRSPRLIARRWTSVLGPTAA